MLKSFYAAAVYTLLGLGAGLFYREYTKAHDFTGESQLSVLHTHLLALGTLFFLIVLALDKAFTLSGTKMFTWFFWVYNGGLLLTVAMMVVHGVMTVAGKADSDAVAGIAGLGHIVLTVAFVLFFLALRRPIVAAMQARGEAAKTD
jgi:hypothetical protein